MKKRIAALLICAIFLLSLAGCKVKYNEDRFIGKTSAQIESEFGPFDCCGMPAGTNGLYQNTACGYTVRKPRVGFFGTDPEILLFISFDENGIARNCYEGCRPGG